MLRRIMTKIVGLARRHPLTAFLIIILIIAGVTSGIRISANSETTATVNPAPGLANATAISVFTMDPTEGETGTISYALMDAANVRVRIVDREDPELIYKTLIHFEPQEPGMHELEWDGKDASGNYVDPFEVRIHIQAEVPEVELSPHELEMFSLPGRPYGHLHSLCDQDRCGFYTMQIIEPEPESVLKGDAQLLIEVVGPFMGYAAEGGVGIRGYVDRTLVLDQWLEPEDVNANFPYITWTLDTSAFPDGEHILYFDMCDHSDHPGLVSLKAEFKN